MKQFIRDLFMTIQSDGGYKYDLTNPAYSAVPWILGIFVYIGLGVFKCVTHVETFSLMDYATGFGALFAGGGIGVLFHSKANV